MLRLFFLCLFISSYSAQAATADSKYLIGDEWGKKPVTSQSFVSNDFYYQRMAMATARIRNGGTGFYLGKYNGQHLLATNMHVCPSANACAAAGAINFTLIGKRYTMSEFIGSWTEIDLAILAFKVKNSKEEMALTRVASPFSFDTEIETGMLLTTMGHGFSGNPRGRLVANQDSDCVAFSGKESYRFMADPDDLNPLPYQVWSFANGCDVSHGDSGSAMMGRLTGKVVGIIWTGVIPKSDPRVFDSSFIQSLLENPSEFIWQNLSYAVPAVKIKTVLLQKIQEGSMAAPKAQTLRELINKNSR